MSVLEIKNLHASVDGKKILNGVSLTVKDGEVHAIMGPNGSGKSTLSFLLMGHPKYKIDSGEILFDGKNISELSADKRAKLGMFLGFQYPSEIAGVSVFNFLRTTYNSLQSNGHAKEIPVLEFASLMNEKAKVVGIEAGMVKRNLNEGFSGGEKKRNEILQMAVLKPKLAILDEPDSGTDIDGLRNIANGINKVVAENKTGVLLITHYNRILQHVRPNFVHIFVDGKIVKSGGPELAEEVEKSGYEVYKNN